MRLLFVQYAGDYRETIQRFEQGRGETYYAQQYSVDAVAKIGMKVEEVIVLCGLTEKPYNEVLTNGVRAIGAGLEPGFKGKDLVKLIDEQNPTHLVARTPIREIYQWSIQKKISTLSILADSFLTHGIRNKIRNFQLSLLLNKKQVHWVANHGVQSSLLLQKIGVNPDKIIPWDWPALITPDSFSSKTLRTNPENWNLIYIGSVTELKGTGDVLEAIAKLKEKNIPVRLKVAGRGDTDYFIKRVKELNLESFVDFLGLVPNNEIVKLMKESDVVLVPSRHEYPEGFPMTIYEGLCSRTPIVASDHPMFKDNLKHETDAMIFPAGNSLVLARMIEKLLTNSELYNKISVGSYEAWQQLQIPVKWAELVERWIDNSPENKNWLFEHRLASGRYNSLLR